MILLIDNYDSFVFNLARYFERLGQTTRVVRNDALDADDVRRLKPAALVLSPGPCTPREAGRSLELVRRFHRELPILGVCLGHQTIVAALGGNIVRAAEPMHGRTSRIIHDGRGVFEGLPNPIAGCRYHSLVADGESIPSCLRVSARSVDGTVMAVAHYQLPVVGLQFHPESILTDTGYGLLASFLRLSEIDVEGETPSMSNEYREPAPAVRRPLPGVPVTF